jgi:hypothetical protein
MVQSTSLEITHCLLSLSQRLLEIRNHCHATAFVTSDGHDAVVDDQANVGLALVQLSHLNRSNDLTSPALVLRDRFDSILSVGRCGSLSASSWFCSLCTAIANSYQASSSDMEQQQKEMTKKD